MGGGGRGEGGARGRGGEGVKDGKNRLEAWRGTENTDAAFTPGIFLGNGAFLASVARRSRRQRKDGSRRWDTGSEKGEGVGCGRIDTAACWQLYQVTL